MKRSCPIPRPTACRFINADGYASTGQGILGNNMFAYCGNSPVINYDSGGNYYASMEDRLTTGHGGGGYAPAPYIIDNQEDPYIGGKPLGLTTVSHGGCGPVAVHNALVIMGDYSCLDKILDYYNDNTGNQILYGFLGTKPMSIRNYFEQNGYRVYMTEDPMYMDIYSQTADAAIIYYERGVPGFPHVNTHFAAYHRVDGGYLLRNVFVETGARTLEFTHPSMFIAEQDIGYAVGFYIYK